ncbi:MAG: transglycosylase domain-containing protein [Bacteroidales bacterium]|nr:transglycosylase domain-containing protein [Bacteroidales bacterium]
MTEKTRRKITTWFWILLTAPFALVLVLLLFVGLFAKLPSFEELEHPDNKLATQVLAEDGEVLTTFHIENRTYASYDELSPNLVHAAVATEDVRFYKHSGIDMKGLARVVVKTLLLHDSSQGGGSTITQQLAKTLYPRGEKTGKLELVLTKFKEWITAVRLERDYTKDEIIAMYLNSIFFGSGAYGVKSAAETFFAKSPADLSIEESAMLVGMVNKPTRYNPVLNPDNALKRRNFVLGQMAKAGYIEKSERDSLQALPIVLDYHVLDHNSGHAPYFRDMLRRDMNASKPRRADYQFEEDYSADSLRWATDAIYGWLKKNKKPDGSSYNLDKDGLRIYTTINYKMQVFAEEAVEEHLGGYLQSAFNRELRGKRNKPFANDIDQATVNRLMAQARKWSDRWRTQKKAGRSEQEILAQFDKPQKMRVFAWNKKGYIDTTMTPNDSIRYYKSFLRCGFVAMEAGTGNVKAFVGGPNYRYFKYDNVSQAKRQVGSTIKPFLYTLAMQEGMTPCDRVVCTPQTFVNWDGSTWTPRSTDKKEIIGQTVTLKWGLANSSNNISAFLMKQFGPQAMAQMMHRMGIHSHVDEVYALCVGPADIALYEMVAAYNTFPSRGVYASPLYVTRIEDNQGNIITEHTGSKREAISASSAYLMANLMQGVVNGGTGSRLRYAYNLQGEIAGKTGTTNDCSDGWFIGYTPKITAGAWIGGEDRQIHFNSLDGSRMALPIWGIWMKKCIAAGILSDKDTFQAPANIDFSLDCTSSGTFLGGDEDANEATETANNQETDYYFN